MATNYTEMANRPSLFYSCTKPYFWILVLFKNANKNIRENVIELNAILRNSEMAVYCTFHFSYRKIFIESVAVRVCVTNY